MIVGGYVFFMVSSLVERHVLCYTKGSNEHFLMDKKSNIQAYMRAHPHLVWYVKDASELSPASVVEHVLNYGTWQDVRELIALLGIHETADIFRTQAHQPRNNYRPQIRHYFDLYFTRYAA